MFDSCSMIGGTGFSNWGLCLQEVLGGDPTMATLIILGIFAFVAFKLNMPHEVSLTLGVGLIIAMAIMFSSPVLYAIMILAVLAVIVYFVRGLMKPAKR